MSVLRLASPLRPSTDFGCVRRCRGRRTSIGGVQPSIGVQGRVLPPRPPLRLVHQARAIGPVAPGAPSHALTAPAVADLALPRSGRPSSSSTSSARKCRPTRSTSGISFGGTTFSRPATPRRRASSETWPTRQGAWRCTPASAQATHANTSAVSTSRNACSTCPSRSATPRRSTLRAARTSCSSSSATSRTGSTSRRSRSRSTPCSRALRRSRTAMSCSSASTRTCSASPTCAFPALPPYRF